MLVRNRKVFSTDFLLLQARVGEGQLFNRCHRCMQSAACRCGPKTVFPTEFSSESEWEEIDESVSIDVPIMNSRISISNLNKLPGNQCPRPAPSASTFLKLKK